VHPTSHPLVKFKHDYVRDAFGYEQVFDFVHQTRLQSKSEPSLPVSHTSAASSSTVPVNSSPSPSATSEAKVILPRVTHAKVIEGDYFFPRVPTDEPHGLVVSTIEVSTVKEPQTVQLASIPSVTVPASSLEEVPVAAISPVESSVHSALQPASPPSLKATYVPNNDVPGGRTFPAGAEFVKTWLIHNSGEIAWPETTNLEFVGGLRLGAGLNAPKTYHVGRAEPGAEVEVHAYHMKAPEVAGEYESRWRLTDGNGEMFGDELWCECVLLFLFVYYDPKLRSAAVFQCPSRFSNLV
jgi:hypothetical protein